MLEEPGSRHEIGWIANEPTTVRRRCLVSGVAEDFINQDYGHEARSPAMLLLHCCQKEPIMAEQERIRIEIYLRDNLV